MNLPTFPERVEEHIADVKQLASKFADKLNQSFMEAHADFLRFHGRLMRLYTARDYANNMHVHLRDRIRRNFTGVEGVYFDERPGKAFKLLIDGRAYGVDVFLAFILKKQGRGYRTANIPTKTVTNFSKQFVSYVDFKAVIQESLFSTSDESYATVVNVPNCANLVAGYQIDPTWSSFQQLAITMPFSFRNILLIEDFTTATAESVAEIVEIRQPQGTKAPRVRRRTTAVSKRDEIRKYVGKEEREIAPSERLLRKVNERNS